jgi:hypothetical protein
MNHVVPLVILPIFGDICMSMTIQSYIRHFFIPSVEGGKILSIQYFSFNN